MIRSAWFAARCLLLGVRCVLSVDVCCVVLCVVGCSWFGLVVCRVAVWVVCCCVFDRLCVRLLFAVCRLVFVRCCLLFGICCSLFDAWCALFGVC